MHAFTEKEIWTKLISFLERELHIQQRKSMINQSERNSKWNIDIWPKFAYTSRNDSNLGVTCLCGSQDHGVLEMTDRNSYALCL